MALSPSGSLISLRDAARIEPSAHPPPRSPTLESQVLHPEDVKRWWRVFFSEEELPDDAAEKALDKAGEKRLRRSYRRFKYRSVPDLGALLGYCVHPPLDSDEAETIDVEELHTFTAYVEAVDRILSKSPEDGLCILAISKTLPSGLERKLFSTYHKLVATFRGQLRSLPQAPINILTCLVSHAMDIPRDHLESPDTAILQNLRLKPLTLPSDETGKEDMEPPGHDLHYLLTWQSHPPTFSTDIDVYIWEHHKSLPESSYADIRLYTPSSSSSHSKRLIIQFRDPSSMLLFIQYREPSNIYRPSVRAESQMVSPISEVIFSICATFQVMIKRTASFIEDSSIEINHMNLKARRNPTADKIWYLVHFDDCCTSANNGISQALEVLDSMGLWIETRQQEQPSNILWDGGEPFNSRLSIIRRDLEYLQQEMDRIRTRIKDLQGTIREHLELNHTRRNWIITIVAAIYLPLSFATSFFGMNIDGNVKPMAESFSAWMNSTISQTSFDTGNQTQALVSAITTSGTLSFSWKAFGITAGCLIVTLPLSLTLGGIARLTVRWVTHYVAYWRVFAIIPSLAFFFFSVFPWFLRSLYFAYNGLLIGFLMLRMYIAWKDHVRLPLWSALFVITVVFFVVSTLFSPDLPIMVIPWLCYAYCLLRPWWRRRKQYRRKTAGG